MKRKYARMSDPKEVVSDTYECSNRKCKWQGKEEDKLLIPDSEISCAMTYVCPMCGCQEFRQLLK